MRSLSSIKKPVDLAPMISIFGEGGMTKTTTASSFPNPIFICTEEGLGSIPSDRRPDAFELCKSSQDVLDCIQVLRAEDHDYMTVVIDTVTKLNVIIEQEIIASDGRNAPSINLALGGYGAGHAAVSEVHRRVKWACDELRREKGMNVIFLGHADQEKIDLPDQEAFGRHTLRLNRKSISHYSDDLDCVALLRQRLYTSGRKEELKKATTDGTIIMTCYPQPSSITKNRFGVTEDVVVVEGSNPFSFIPAIQKQEAYLARQSSAPQPQAEEPATEETTITEEV